MAQVSEKTKEKIQKQIDALALQIKKAGEYADRAKIELKRLEEELEELKRKPMKKINNKAPYCLSSLTLGYEITHYFKHSDAFVEFEANGCKYRYIKSYASVLNRFPPRCNASTIVEVANHIFEIYEYASREWRRVDYIDHIELIPGVDKYDKN